MIEIKGIRTADNGGTILIEFEITPNGDEGKGSQRSRSDRRSLLLLPEQYRELKLGKGVVTEEKFRQAEKACEVCRAVRRGRYLLTFGANSGERLRAKLRQRGFSSEVVAEAAEIIAGEGAINEERDAVREAELRVRRGDGRRRVIAHLRSRGYGNEAICRAEEYLDGVDFKEVCRRVIEKKYGGIPKERDERQKCIAAMMRRGFTMAEIRWAGADPDSDPYPYHDNAPVPDNDNDPAPDYALDYAPDYDCDGDNNTFSEN